MDEAFIADIEAIPWFSRVGQSIIETMPWPATQVADWGKAFACYDDAWVDIKHAAFSRLTTFLYLRNPGERDRRWNPLISDIQARLIRPLVDSVWRPFGERNGLTPLFSDVIAGDIRRAAAEHEFRRSSGLPTFFLPLLRVYRAGHFPCGWCGGEWPEGELVVL